MPGEVYFEYHRVGPSVRVTAMDADSLTEVVLIVPVGTPEGVMQAQALQKLRYVMAKRGG